jgi:hypothetical protein
MNSALRGAILKANLWPVSTLPPISLLSSFRRFGNTFAALLAAFFLAFLVSGCNRFHQKPREMAYVSTVRPIYLHDRVAPVSTRVCQVVNGQPLQVLERRRRFLKVETDKQQIGWIEEMATIDEQTYEGFVKLAAETGSTPVAAKGILIDDLAMHLSPGRNTPRFYLIPGNSKVELLARATAPRKPAETQGPLPPSKPAKAAEVGRSAPSNTKGEAEAARTPAAAEETVPPEMDDWWLARDAQGHVGWLLASRLDVDVPDDVAQYAESQRIVGAWVLKKVNDPDPDLSNHEIPEYLMALSAPTNGLPYDFDQVRVFTWSLKHHRYETAFRLRPIQGYLPVRVFTQETERGMVPAFSFEIANGASVATDPTTGITRPVAPRTIGYQMVDTRVERIGPAMGPISTAHRPGAKKPKMAAKKRKGKR